MLSRRALMGGGLASLLVGHEAYAQCVPLDMSNATDKEIDERIKRRMRDYRIPALSLAVVRDGIVRCASYGAAALIPLVQATPKTGYHIGSVGKQFVATAIMLLVEDGTLQLDDQARGYLRQRPPQTWNGITVRHLLTHTSGLLREPIIGDTTDLASVISKSYDEPLLWCPGFRYRYSNLGYFVLAEIIQYVLAEVIRDRAFPDWSTFIEKRVFKPAALNMTRPTNRTRGLALAKRNGFVSLTRHAALRPSG